MTYSSCPEKNLLYVTLVILLWTETDAVPACEAKKAKAEKDGDNFVPACDEAGFFEAKQCEGQVDSDWCWCSQPDGNPVTGTFHSQNATRNYSHICVKHRGEEDEHT